MGEEAVGEALGEERRQHQRTVSQAHKLLRATLGQEGGTPEEVYLFLVDISEGGMRVNLDRSFPEGHTSRLTFSLGGREFAVDVVPQWQRCLADGVAAAGTWSAGLAFRDPDRDTVDFLFSYFSTTGRRLRFRLRELLTVTMRRAGDENPWWSLTTTDLSMEGLRARWDDPLDVGEEIEVKVFPPDLPDVDGRGQVMWVNEALPGRWEFGVRFTELSATGHESLMRYIDRCVGAD